MTVALTKPKTTPTADATRAEIVRHAAELFSHYGYAKTNIGDIAKCCGMSPGNLYRYFKNKQAIGEEVVHNFMAASEAEMGMVLRRPDTDFEAKLRGMVDRGVGKLIQELRQNPKIVELADMICEGNSSVLARHVEWKQTQFENLIRAGCAEGTLSVDDPKRTARAIYDATKVFWMPMALTQMDLDTVPERVSAVLDLLIAGTRT